VKLKIFLPFKALSTPGKCAVERFFVGMCLHVTAKMNRNKKIVRKLAHKNKVGARLRRRGFKHTDRHMPLFSVNDLGHPGYRHLNGFSPVCTRVCLHSIEKGRCELFINV
jgi:hypothetical protein